MNKKQSQSGFAHLIIIIILIVALVGALGFVYWQNFMQPKTSSENVVATETTDDNAATDIIPVVTNEGYLVLDDWGVKFKLPSDLGDNQVTYFKGSDNYSSEDSYSLLTKNVSDLGGWCAVDGASQVVIFRTEVIIGTEGLYPNSPIESAGKVGVYNYYVHPAQMPCDEGKNVTTQVQDRDMLTGLLMSVEKI